VKPAATASQLEAEGFTLRFTASEPALSEHVKQYEELGFEVRLVSADPSGGADPSCATCLGQETLVQIWVRRRT
jgi:hypothetical protein